MIEPVSVIERFGDRACRDHPTFRHRQLQLHQIDAEDGLGDWVFDLEAGVHLEEPEPGRVIRVDKELDGSRALVVDRRSGSVGRLVQRGTDLIGKARRRRLLDHLLVASLDGAVTLAEDEYAAGVAHDLDLDVANVLDVPLDEDSRVPERIAGLGRGGGNLVG